MNDLLLLSTLLAGPLHGYALKKQAGLISGRPSMHNNLVYPLLKRFVDGRLVTKRRAAGQRGQTRDVYALTSKGKRDLLVRLQNFTAKEAASANEFCLRVGLFGFLTSSTQMRILLDRQKWLSGRTEKLTRLRATMDVGKWGGEVVQFLLAQASGEQDWIVRLQRESRRAPAGEMNQISHGKRTSPRLG